MKDNSYKIPRSNLKIYAFVYDKLLEFHESDIPYDTITTSKLLRMYLESLE